jgi:peptidylprolyl isomerase
MTEQARLKCTVYVGGLDQSVTMHTLAEAFVPFGEVVDITLPKPDVPNTNEAHRGFGYVEFDLPEDAKEAIDNMDGSELYGRTIKVAAAKPQKDSNEGLGSKTAIWEQVRMHSLYTRCLILTTSRRDIWPNTPSVKKTAWPPMRRRWHPMNALATQCKAWKS